MSEQTFTLIFQSIGVRTARLHLQLHVLMGTFSTLVTLIRKNDNTFIPLCSHLPLEGADRQGYTRQVVLFDCGDDEFIPFEIFYGNLGEKIHRVATEASHDFILTEVSLRGLQFENGDSDDEDDFFPPLLGFKHIDLHYSVPAAVEFTGERCSLEFNQIAAMYVAIPLYSSVGSRCRIAMSTSPSLITHHSSSNIIPHHPTSN